MEKRKLGKSGLIVAPLTFGGNVFGWTVDKKQSFKLLDAFVDADFNFIDTADTYSWWADGNKGGESEAIIGDWFTERKNRDKIILSTKVGSKNNEHPVNVSKKFILKSVEDSLRRLKTDYIDLYQTHFDDESTPVEETLSAYQQLIKEGKVRVIGTSNMSPERIRESLKASEKEGLPKYQTLQPLYNLMEREKYETDLRGIVEENNMGVLSYFSLASGFLTGKYRSKDDLDKSQRGDGVDKYLNKKGFKVLESLDKISEKYNTAQAAISLAWLIARPTITAPIVSATNLKQMESIIKAPQLKLDEDDMELLNNASA
ncbi:aldo/keto reductase [Aequorivita sp. CIP111184]|uniref:aldo/keto reductase n=1 Tax=Aequorivita sp. CIP111184 TaxID=2211356 RepID=UPI000DBBEC7A|nr:aldo/keto reductase [Aequorivita sp. CIP111184]SRX54442.1 General stress protein 69 [Aequorivita sp. CIP111184]